ncbi:MAG: hypothetical protein OEY14_11135 [Myxococcales bacterium]|nr:hypothetical protein [Myxococcales bacterium]
MEHFASFERWARSALVAEQTRREPAALEETLFAPLRRDPALLGARVERRGVAPLVISHPRDFVVDPALDWLSLRHPRLGAIAVAQASRDVGGGASLYVRRRDAGRAGLELLLAYRLEGGDP